jgi:hypothetical protein
MTETDAKLRSLLQMKKLETPGEAYFEAFLQEFHRYQRAEILRQPTWQERFSVWVESLQGAVRLPQTLSWTTAGVAACLALAFGIVAFQPLPSTSGSLAASPSPSDKGYVMAPGSDIAVIDRPDELGVASASSFDQDFASPRYVTGQALVAYDTELAF